MTAETTSSTIAGTGLPPTPRDHRPSGNASVRYRNAGTVAGAGPRLAAAVRRPRRATSRTRIAAFRIAP